MFLSGISSGNKAKYRGKGGDLISFLGEKPIDQKDEETKRKYNH